MKKAKIFFVSSEIYPFVKGGRGGEFAGALPTYLQMQGHEVRVIMPKYSLINERKYIIRDIIRMKEIPVPMLHGEIRVSVKSGFLPESKTQIYFADFDKYYKRADLYRDRRTGQFFKDNDERFIFLARTAIETLKTLGWQPDIVHCCGWSTGILPAMIRHEQEKDNFFRKTIVVYSINDMAEVGLFDKSILEKTLLPKGFLEPEKCFYKNKLSFLKTGMAFSDAVTIPSTFKKIKSFSKPKDDFEHIVAGAKNLYDLPFGGDHNLWNPANNSSLFKPYSIEKYERRKANRETILENKRINFSSEQMILGILCENIHYQFKEVVNFLKAIKDIPLQVLLVADESPNSIPALKNQIAKNDRQTIHTLADPEDQFRHAFYTLCDMFYTPVSEDLLDIHYLNGIHYGTIPLVSRDRECSHAFEGIKPKSGGGEALIFTDEKELVKKIEEALDLYKETEKWQSLVFNAMRTDVSWNNVIPQVTKIYEKAFSRLK